MKSEPAAERVQKALARAGIGSRRQIEGWIKEGRIKINGKTAIPGAHVSSKDKIKFDNRIVRFSESGQEKTKVLAYYKPVGEICARSDPKHKKTVFDKLPKLSNGRWINIGRLDINTIGLLLFTNNVELANRLMHPSSQVEREYAVRVLGEVSNKQLQAMLKGVRLDDGYARFSDIVDSGGEGANHWYHVVLMEGRNREVRRLWESQGVKVSRLMRVRFGSYILPRSKHPGEFWNLNESDIKALNKDVEK
ncbi:MAG: pseudouridine synthase [Gammaproteobacteria bacterium]|nr:pseudouridine synthase [Gammaproteobacteria bacterium]